MYKMRGSPLATVSPPPSRPRPRPRPVLESHTTEAVFFKIRNNISRFTRTPAAAMGAIHAVKVLNGTECIECRDFLCFFGAVVTAQHSFKVTHSKSKTRGSSRQSSWLQDPFKFCNVEVSVINYLNLFKYLLS